MGILIYTKVVKAGILDRKFLVQLGMQWLRLKYRSKPVPINNLIFLRKLTRGEDPLFPAYRSLIKTGKSLRNPLLANRLADIEMGIWSLSTDTLDFLERQIHVIKPQFILEYGSGNSTACLARYMQELHDTSNRLFVLSIEQEISFAKKTVELLKELQLERCAQVIYSPLRRQVIEGIESNCYDFNIDITEALEQNYPDFIVIDGPSAEKGARFGTLPLTLPFLGPKTWFFLDDALRDGEVEIAQQWNKIPKVIINGVYLVGKGILAGQVVEGNI